ncbi:MAG TPA: hypothetical protein VLT45_03215 [Kofleriaceae bacterium]|nr:hypothetical protein [Kofleriaceae bacterium]
MKRLGLILLAAASTAYADPKHTLVLKSDGNASADTKSKIDTQILKLAKSIGGNVEAGEISFVDATAAVGCNPTESSCKDEVLTTLGVDEVVVTTVDKASSGGTTVTVRRVSKSGMPKEQTTTIPAGQAPDAKLNNDIGPMFGAVQAAPTPPPAPAPAAEPAPPPPTVAPVEPAPPPPTTTTTTPPKPLTTAQVEPTVTAAPNGQVTQPNEGRADHRRLELTGMGVGGGLVLLSLVMWAEASSTQSDIDNAPTRTAADLKNLQDLESQGDTYATLGNVMFIGGLGVAAVSTYFWWRDRRADHGQQARIAPTVFDHGAGVTLSFGGGL